MDYSFTAELAEPKNDVGHLDDTENRNNALVRSNIVRFDQRNDDEETSSMVSITS